MKALRRIDFALHGLIVLIAVLLLTGGVFYSSPKLKLELAQIDLFAWAIFVFCLWRARIAQGKFVSPLIEKHTASVLRLFEKETFFSLLVCVGVYALLHVWISVWRYQSLHANAFDLSYVDQPLWATTRVGFLYSSLARGNTYLGEHFAPILGGVSLIYRLWDSVYALFIFQTFLIASSAFLIFWLARIKGLSRNISVVLALCFLLYHPVRAANVFDFREDDFFIPVFLGLLIAFEKKRWSIFWRLIVLCWLIKENAPIFTGLMGGWILLTSSKKNVQTKVHGIVLGALSILVFIFVNFKLTPYFAGSASETKAVHRLGQFGKSNIEIIQFMFLHPFAFIWGVLKPVFQWNSIKYFFQVTTPFLWVLPGVSKQGKLMAIIVALGLLMNMVVNLPTVGFHYECILIAFLFYILILGLSERPSLKPQSVFLILVSFFLFFGRSPVFTLRQMMPDDHQWMVHKELEKIPQDASVTTQSALHPHLTHRKDAYLFSPGKILTDYVIFDFHPETDRYGTPNLEGDRQRLDMNLYSKVFDQDHLVIYKRTK